MKKNMKKIMALLLTVTLSLGLYGCGSKNDKTESGTSTAAESDTSAAATDGSEKKTLVIGDTTSILTNEELDVNPHNSYSGWACIRYGIGETLVKYSDDMELQPWLAKNGKIPIRSPGRSHCRIMLRFQVAERWMPRQ